MTLAKGTKLGPYEVVTLLGAGGMGEVYRARDVRVDRAVALKVLPEEFFESEERRQRFEREARMLASLSHPGIAVLYSFEEIPGSSPSSSRRHSRHGARRRRGPRSAPRFRPPSPRRISFVREADRGGPGGGARERDRPPRPQALQRKGDARRPGEAAGLRPREDLRGGGRGRGGNGRRPHGVSDALGAGDGGGRHPRHGGVHEPRAGSRQAGRQADGRLGLRLRPLRDADRKKGLRRGNGFRHARRDTQGGPELGGAAGADAGEDKRSA